jgi:hypothetical protein
MATVIVRTNPDQHYGGWRCSQCGVPCDSWQAAKDCAEADYVARRGRPPTPVVVDVVAPPCDADAP